MRRSREREHRQVLVIEICTVRGQCEEEGAIKKAERTACKKNVAFWKARKCFKKYGVIHCIKC